LVDFNAADSWFPLINRIIYHTHLDILLPLMLQLSKELPGAAEFGGVLATCHQQSARHVIRGDAQALCQHVTMMAEKRFEVLLL
jgi:hypothetical protein